MPQTPLDYGMLCTPSLIPYGNLAAQDFSCFLRPWFNPLTTNDVFWHHQILAACYQLVQSVLKMVCTRVGQVEVGGSTALADSAWWQLQLVNDGWVICLLSCINGRRKRSFHLVGIPFRQFRLFLVWRIVLWSKGPDY